ncbi:hypothetical protein TNCT_421381 [Trichonephila clavata]|uniref:Autophagy-related protein n=1 Tax=Trichonephila clavata TaxID=2740835 RepID=A0A8X6J5K2_TRICU|nr:hypothetical protein TNCT_421381 [Trichonephila clavata]
MNLFPHPFFKVTSKEGSVCQRIVRSLYYKANGRIQQSLLLTSSPVVVKLSSLVTEVVAYSSLSYSSLVWIARSMNPLLIAPFAEDDFWEVKGEIRGQKGRHTNRRQEETKLALEKYPGRIPVTILPAKASKPTFKPCRFLVPVDMTVFALKNFIRTKLELQPYETFFIMVKNMMPVPSLCIIQIYEEYKSPDGYLRITYGSEEVFG